MVNIFKISWKNLIDKRLNSFLCILLMTLGIAIISLLLLLSRQLQEKFTKNISGIDMVVGAKGSPLQLILSSVYQIDSPTGNIPMSELEILTQNPMIKEAIPLSMGDNYKAFRIIGTSPKYLKHFEATIVQGRVFQEDLEIVLGANTAQDLGLKLGDTFASSHGLDAAGEAHEHQKYKVVGILDYNNSVLDNLILTTLGSVWAVHSHQSPVANQQSSEDKENATSLSSNKQEITSILVKFRSPLGMMTLPRNINQNTQLQAAVPAIEVNRLFELLGVGVETLKILAFVIMLIAGVSVFVSLYNSLKERRYEMALMLSMGASRTKLFLMLLLEGIILSLVGFFIGILLCRVGLLLISKALDSKFHFSIQQFSIQNSEIYLFFAALLIGILAAIIPSLGVYRLNISRTLADE